jgi:hypothetical protein
MENKSRDLFSTVETVISGGCSNTLPTGYGDVSITFQLSECFGNMPVSVGENFGSNTASIFLSSFRPVAE